MSDFTYIVLMAFAMIFVIEGLIYGLYPDGIRKMMALAQSIPTEQFRFFGLSMALLGALFLWLLKNFATR